MAKVIQWKHGSSTEHASFTGAEKELTIDDDLHTIRVHDGVTPGGTALALLADVPTKLSDLTDDIGVWTKDTLVNLSQLTNDAGFWLKTDLTKISQLTNDSGFLTGHCSYCTHCTYCQQCSNCHNCTTINCTTINCTTIQCSAYSYCYYCKNCNCSNCDCGDDSCFVSGMFETKRGLVDVHEIRVGDELISFTGESVKVVGVSHGWLSGRRVIRKREIYCLTDDHPIWMGIPNEYRFFENGSFDANRVINAENGVKGRFSETNTYHPELIPTVEMSPFTPTVCPITEREMIIKFGAEYVLIPGRIE